MFSAKATLSRLCCLVWLAVVIGCQKDDTPLPNYQDYFPLKKGNYWIYQIQERSYTPYNVEEAVTYQLKIAVTDSFMNASNNYSYVMARFKRNSVTDSWASFDTWTARFDNQQLIVNEENTPYVRLSFPIIKSKEWNGNQYNSEESTDGCGDFNFISCDIYAYDAPNLTTQLSNGRSFEKTIRVIENDFSDVFTHQDVRNSTYANGVGIISREIKKIEYCTSDPTIDCYGKQMIKQGVVVKMELTDYGRE